MFIRAFAARARYVFVFATLATALTGLRAFANLPACATPHLDAPAYAAGASNTVRWTLPGGPVGNGFTIEIATAVETDADGSFVDANLERLPVGPVSPSARERVVDGLAERQHYYHIRSEARSGVNGCATSQWSGIVSTIQDATKPAVHIASDNGTLFVGRIELTGTAEDPSGPSVPSASGARRVRVWLERMTPGGLILEGDLPSTVVDVIGGSWSATLEGTATGLYLAGAAAFDGAVDPQTGFGNESDPESVTVAVYGAPGTE
jgi:hypothetical protein